jgi:hypothetical protein
MAEVFISFIHEQERVARAVQGLLRENLRQTPGMNAVEVFMSSDEWQVLAGEVWFDRILRELNAARVLVALMSPQSVSRPWVNFEAGAAWAAGKPVVPICFGGIERDNLPRPYSALQAINLPDDGYYLFTSVARHLDRHAFVRPPFFVGDPELAGLVDALGHERDNGA